MARRRFALSLALSLVACTQPARPGEDLRRTVHDAVVLLESNRFGEFLERYMVPYERGRLFPGLTPEEKAAKFRDQAGAKLLHRLHSAEKMEPILKPGNVEASYALDPPLRFIRHEGTWRILD